MKQIRAALFAFVIFALVVATPGASLAAPSSLINTSLLAYWKLEEASGTRLDELNGCGGSGCDLTDNNTVTQATGKLGNAGQFTAANSEYLSHADHADLSIGDTDFTMMAWVYADSIGAGGNIIIGKLDNTSTAREYFLESYTSAGNTRLRFVVSAAGTAQSGAVDNIEAGLTLSAWHLVIAWHDSVNNSINYQLDNGTVKTAAYTLGIFDGPSVFQVGTLSSLSRYWNGRIDSVGIWRRVLTSTERTCLYNSGTGVEYPFTACDPTATPTQTYTPSNTATYTATFTPSHTATFTPTFTFTASLTPSDTPTFTLTPSLTFTPSETATETLTPSHTPTDTVVPTDTLTPTATWTPLSPVPNATCADSFVFPLDTGNTFTVPMCADVGSIVTGTAVLGLTVLTAIIFMYSRTRAGL